MPHFSFAIAFLLVWLDQYWQTYNRVYNQTQPVYNKDRTGS
jgi:hypothetical protein